MNTHKQTIWTRLSRSTATLLTWGIATLCIVSVNQAQAARICVPSSFDGSCNSSQGTISLAITNATSGVDDVYVQAGTYNENIDFGGKNITILSASGAASTFIKGTSSYNNNPVVKFISGESSSAVLDGFTIDNNTENAADTRGITITNSTPTIQNCIIENNQAYFNSPGLGGGIKTTGTGGATISGTTIKNNTTGTSGEFGGGIYHSGSSLLSMTGGSIESNFAYKGGGGIYGTSGDITLDGVTVKLNSSTTGGIGGAGGIHYSGGGTLTIQNSSSIESNSTTKYGGGGIYLSASTLNITSSTIKSNTSSGDLGGGGMLIEGASTVTISKSHILGNHTTGPNNNSDGGGIKLSASGTATITNTVIAGNVTENAWDADGGGIANYGTLNLYHSTVADNYSYDDGGGILAAGTENIYNSIVINNTWGHGTGNIQITGTTENQYLTEVTTDPDFSTDAPASASTPTTGGVYSLNTGSGSIDTGDSTNAPADDIDGTSRPQGSDYDKGAYEKVSASGPTNTFTSGTYNSSTNTLVFTGTNFDTIDTVSTDVKSYMDWTKFSWDVNGDNATTANIGVTNYTTEVTSLTITNATTLTLVFTTSKANAIEATTDASLSGGVDTLDITAGFSKTSGGTPATTDALTDGSFTIDDNEFDVTKTADTSDGACTLADCSLREAVDAANGTSGATSGSPHIVNIPNGTYTITITGDDGANASGDFDVSTHTKFIGNSQANTIIAGAATKSRVFQDVGTAEMTFDTLTIRNGDSTSLGSKEGGCIRTDGNLATLNNVTMDNCTATYGGAIVVTSTAGGNVTATNSTFTNNSTTSSNGGAIAANTGTITVNSSTFTDNTSGASYGGAISAPTVVVENNSVFKGNSSSANGGAIYATTDLTVSDSTFGGAGAGEGNSSGWGGALFLTVANQLLVERSTFLYNTATSSGGAIGSYGGTISSSVFEYNSAAGAEGGGALYSGGDNHYYVNNDAAGGTESRFSNNSATTGCGGAIRMNPSNNGYKVTANDSTFENNSAADQGGAICGQRSSKTVLVDTDGSHFANNSAGWWAGAIFARGNIVITNSSFDTNTSGGRGGAVTSWQAVTATNSTFYNNSTDGSYESTQEYGGAIFGGALTINNST
ncbi:beta strand repeat-containing protein, partial [Pseudomonadota bacterium]